ncbi:MAG: acetyl-CoA acetyltransferase [Pseudomonadota bacterium]
MSRIESDTLPVLVGVGQTVGHWGGECPREAPSPLKLCVDAARNALEDSGTGPSLSDRIDAVAVVRTLEDSIPKSPYPFGRCENYPGAVSQALQLSPSIAVYSAVGGDQPQRLVNEFAARLYHRECRAVLLCGAEATAAFKTAIRGKLQLDWSTECDRVFEDRGIGPALSTRYERKNGLGWPTNSYPLFEEAYRTRRGLTRSQYLAETAELLSGFSQVAATNPYAQFPTARSAQFLETPSKENYPIAGPYLKWHVAQDAVNQGAAVILTTVAEARAAGVPEDRWVYLHGHSALSDCTTAVRPDFSRSRSLEGALALALESSNLSAEQVSLFDIYSCFPCVVFLAAEALKLDWRRCVLTQTGGLPFFGGPGNNYSMHAIASMVRRLRARPEQYGLVLANGGYLSKHAAGVFSRIAPDQWSPVDATQCQATIDAESVTDRIVGDAQGIAEANVESFTVVYGRGGPEYATLVARRGMQRALVKISGEQEAVLEAIAAGRDPVGASIRLRVIQDPGEGSVQGSNHMSDTIPSYAMIGGLALEDGFLC